MRADEYHLTGAGLELTYRRGDRKLDITGDEPLLTHEGLDVKATGNAEMGLHLTATLLDSSRNGTRILLTVLLPEVSWKSKADQDSEKVTGVAIVTRSFKGVVGGPPAVLQSHDDVRQLEGTASAT